jgi:hypothetical protein
MRDLSMRRAMVISQDMLAAAMKRKADKELADRLYEEARQPILSLFALNAEVEPGP